MAGSLAGPLGSVVVGGITAGLGAVAGSVVGAIGGAIAGPIEAASTKNDETLQKATEELALKVSEGTIDTNREDMTSFLISAGVAADEAAIMAEEFASNTGALLEFGQAVTANTAAEKAYYSAMVQNAKQLLNLDNYSIK